MKTPRAEIKVNGKAVASIFNERLISVTIVDKEGVTSDTISCELNDSNPFADIPKKGDKLSVSLGYLETGMADFGTYTIDDPEVRCLPYAMTINGKGANVRDKAKQHRSRHWDKKTVKEIVTQIAGENGLSPMIDDEVGSHKYEWFGQQDESDLHVVERLARRHDALFSIKDGKLIFAAKGSGKSASGKDLTAVVASRANIVEGTCRVNFAHRNKFKKVKGRIQDRNKAKLVEFEVESDDEGTADYTLPEPFADEGEAKKAAKSKAKHLKAETIRTSVMVFGDPSIRAGAPFRYDNVRPGVDELEFIIETATHRLSKAGYVTEIEAKLKPVKSAKKNADTGSSSSSSNAAGASGLDTAIKPPSAPPVPSIPAPTPGYGIGRQ
ncbi:MAG TPA: contractile injection system protein, VgrG/Pvc8 family [Mesorhizobium sp.]|uniref:phage late control D family protein n=1 Tax=Mesorhizobium sp. TaxID=1871066 RepID=UPI002DDCFFDA|nr:contractile injection system protein, VgrG/Pvc8 family [Mesorhizobium sp.]HEV2504386.1 contractile injection system protein, VgrG/Pvc8 family [Mesorhizobium sp.]